MADIEALWARWPASPNDLPEAALAVFAAWSRATEETIRKALEEEVGRGFNQLFQAQLADPEDVQTSSYVVGELVLRKLGQGPDGSYSWARIKPIPP